MRFFCVQFGGFNFNCSQLLLSHFSATTEKLIGLNCYGLRGGGPNCCRVFSFKFCTGLKPTSPRVLH